VARMPESKALKGIAPVERQDSLPSISLLSGAGAHLSRAQLTLPRLIFMGWPS
jgi:hypothetical protein